MRIRDLGYSPGSLPTGETNSILDVPGVGISQLTLPTIPKEDTNDEESQVNGRPRARKGLTVLLPRPADQIHMPCHAATHIFNGNGELTGRGQIADWGFINNPIVLTNSLSLGVCFDGAWDWMLAQHAKRGADHREVCRNYGTPVVGETADWIVNSDLKHSKLSAADVAKCFEGIKTSEEGAVVREGSEGGGAGMTCQQYMGGTGTASRVVSAGPDGRDYILGVLVQTNYGHRDDMQIGGVPMGKIFKKEKDAGAAGPAKGSSPDGRIQDGSILVIIMTNAPILPHNLDRIARHATAGLAQVGTYGIGRNGSGDIFLAVSTAEHPSELLVDVNPGYLNPTQTYQVDVVKIESMDAYFYATAEATEEAILNSMVGAREGMVTTDGAVIEGLPVDRVKDLLRKHRVQV